MKATKFFALVAALFAVGCSNNPNSSINPDDTQQGGGEPEVGVLRVSGEANTLATIALGEAGAQEGTLPLVWPNSAEVGLFSLNSTAFFNTKATKAGVIVDAEGNTVPAVTADFTTGGITEVTEGNQFYIYYPYNEATVLAGSFLATSVPAEQTQKDHTVAAPIADYIVGYDLATVGKGGAVNFKLQHPLAYVEVCVSSTEFADYNVKSLELVDLEGNAKLAGDVFVDLSKPANQAVMLAGNGSASVKLNVADIKNDTNLSKGGTHKFWLTTLPNNFADCELWLIVELLHSTNGSTIVLPVRLYNVDIKANAINVINLEGLSSQHNGAKWYAPVDSRLMPQLGYAYGEANTYLIQCKSGTYKGATFTPDANIPGSVRIDIRGRGEFSKIVDVRKATFEWAKNKAGEIYTLDNSNYPHINSAAYTIDDSTKAEGYITVTNNAAHAGAPILLMKLDGKVIWSWTFWNIAADGTSFGDVTIGNHTYANMLLGQSTMQYETWSVNKRSDDSYADFANRTAYVYQWGRPMPQFWQEDFVNGSPNNKQLVCEVAPTVQEIIENPATYYISSNAYLPIDGVKRDMWGDKDKKGSTAGAVCIKSVYDPCPKGYRVADYGALNNLVSLKETASVDNTSGQVGVCYTTSTGSTHKYLNVGFLRGAVKDNGQLDVYGWSNNGALSGLKYNTSWSNATATTSSYSFYINTTDFINTHKMGSHNGDCAMSVRCQKDTDNR